MLLDEQGVSTFQIGVILMEIMTDQRFRKTVKYFRALLIISLVAV